MSVRGSLLAILDQGPCYGYQLRAEFDRRTGAVWPLNVGQIYNTLDRLEREGLVAKGEIDDEGHVYWEITDGGRVAAREWLAEPLDRAQSGRDELAVKIALAASLPGADVTAVIRAQRIDALARLESLDAARTPRGSHDHREEFARALVVDAMISRAEAEVRWLDQTEERLAVHPHHTMALGLSTVRPKRGRPAKLDTSAA
jgi:DNA-binding PadR family transcriptional regulator